MKALLKRFHLNGHIIRFHLQTSELKSPYKTPSSTLAVKELSITLDLFVVYVIIGLVLRLIVIFGCNII